MKLGHGNDSRDHASTSTNKLGGRRSPTIADRTRFSHREFRPSQRNASCSQTAANQIGAGGSVVLGNRAAKPRKFTIHRLQVLVGRTDNLRAARAAHACSVPPIADPMKILHGQDWQDGFLDYFRSESTTGSRSSPTSRLRGSRGSTSSGRAMFDCSGITSGKSALPRSPERSCRGLASA